MSLAPIFYKIRAHSHRCASFPNQPAVLRFLKARSGSQASDYGLVLPGQAFKFCCAHRALRALTLTQQRGIMQTL